MASLEDLMSQIPVSQIAGQLGVDEQTATNAIKTALPTLVGGLQANAQNPDGAASLANALGNHGSLLDGGVDVNQVDTADGQKAVHNIFGSAQNDVVSALGGVSGAGGNALIQKLLPILAPIVLAYVAKQIGNRGGAATGAAGGGGLGDILGGILGGGGAQAGAAGGGLGNVLGGILGGGGAGGLGGILGGLLGGGKK